MRAGDTIQYPAEAEQLGIEGDVKLRVELDERGKVHGIKVTSGLGHGLDQAAVFALTHRCKFTPAIATDGKPVSLRDSVVRLPLRDSALNRRAPCTLPPLERGSGATRGRILVAVLRRSSFALVVLSGLVARAQPIEPPQLVERGEAVYPVEAERAGLDGTVTLELIVDVEGRVAEATVLASAGHGFDEAALAAVRRFRFTPGRADGKPVPVKVTYRYAFTLSSAPAPPTSARLPPPAPVRVRGKVIERGTRTPVDAAAVIAIDETGATLGQTETRADGSFALPLAGGGVVTIVVAAPEHQTLRIKETIGEREALTVRYSLSRSSYALYESTVRAAPAREEVARVSLAGDEVRRIPGTRGDALAAVLNLPSVARSPFDLGQLVIRGSAPGESGAFLMGMAIPKAFHFGGLTSTFNSYLLERFDLDPVELQRALRPPDRRHRRHRAARRAARPHPRRPQDGPLRRPRHRRGSHRQGLVRAVGAAQLRRRRARPVLLVGHLHRRAALLRLPGAARLSRRRRQAQAAAVRLATTSSPSSTRRRPTPTRRWPAPSARASGSTRCSPATRRAAAAGRPRPRSPSGRSTSTAPSARRRASTSTWSRSTRAWRRASALRRASS